MNGILTIVFNTIWVRQHAVLMMKFAIALNTLNHSLWVFLCNPAIKGWYAHDSNLQFEALDGQAELIL